MEWKTNNLLEEALRMINEWLNDNDEMTTTELMHKLDEMNHHASRATVDHARLKLNWSAKPTRYYQLIREVNKYKHVEFRQNLLAIYWRKLWQRNIHR